jgi:hypothetical protein
MADNETTTPLLDGAPRSPSPRRRSLSPVESSVSARHGSQSKKFRPFSQSSESTPLLIRRDDDLPRYVEETQTGFSSRPSRDPSPCSHTNKPTSCPRWPTLVTLALLCGVVVSILVLGFVAPSIVKEYAEEASVFRPREFSIDSTTLTGVRARITADFLLDSSRVRKRAIRDFGRFATWIAKEVETGESEVHVYMPEYGNMLVGTASLPPLKLSIRDRLVNTVEILTDLQPGDITDLHRVANDWLEGRLGQLRIKGIATIALRSGLLSLGSLAVSNTMIFDGKAVAVLPSPSCSFWHRC